MAEDGLRVTLSAIPGETPAGILSSELTLPAVLRTFGWTEEAEHSEYTTVRDGQFSQPSQGDATARRLRGIDDIETLTLLYDPPWLVEQGLDPRDVYSDLFGVLRSRRAVELLVMSPLEDHAILHLDGCTIRSITVQMREGEPDTRYYNLKLVEWRGATVERRGTGSSSKLPTTHKLAAGDTLYSLSMRYYKTALRAEALKDANAIRGWGSKTPLVEMSRFKVGSKFKIPKVS